ncbi:fibronectin type III-like domain-contianing protein [Mucilaginibacter pedocola]|uniref:Fibronectin type III-like domain-containing protein n=1 Tax=Mucilaginibacter pedocola TaxID=1792845 RepID=A0A1S9PH97_9SPHI|nr:fibronectin type III-like domain-contianing protein [Mucilaginibacter pedocola]OOQ60336.1 hypothetical protein BC343_25255 [Mucilaginibacter pedocola]
MAANPIFFSADLQNSFFAFIDAASEQTGFFDKPDPLWAFGYGLSYTNFKYRSCTLTDSVVAADGTIQVEVEVENTGARDGKELVQLYIRDKVSSVATPVMQLKAFKKELIKAGKTARIKLEVPVAELGLYNDKMQYVVEPGEFDIQVGSSCDNIAFHKTLLVK